jgi:tetratricopeptide (TPR) repeat protein
MKRRSLKELEHAVESADIRSKKALALYALALFHDNNSREADAIPHYRAAIRLGLDYGHRAMALAWLASSLFKTGQSRAALRQISLSLKLARPPRLKKFLVRLKKRIERDLSAKN